MFSGRRDPQWVVNPERQSIYGTIQELFSNAFKLRETYELERIPSILGYKGFLLDGGKDWAWAILGNKTKKLQEVLLQSIPEGLISKDLMAKIVNATQKEICLTESKPPSQDCKNLEQNDGLLLHIAERPEQSGILAENEETTTVTTTRTTGLQIRLHNREELERVIRLKSLSQTLT